LIFRIAYVRCGRWRDAAAVAAAGKPDQEFLTAKDAKQAKNQSDLILALLVRSWRLDLRGRRKRSIPCVEVLVS